MRMGRSRRIWKNQVRRIAPVERQVDNSLLVDCLPHAAAPCLDHRRGRPHDPLFGYRTHLQLDINSTNFMWLEL
jgi:hypothetical protein